jgi:uncharacterized OsmC-like protein
MWSLPEYTARKRDRVEALRDQLGASDAPATPLRAVARVAGGSGVRPVHMRDFTVVTDAGAALGGYELGPTAPELLLGALASCLAHSWLIVAARRGLAIETLEVEVTGRIDYRGTLAVGEQAPVPPFDLAYDVRLTSPASDAEIAAVRDEVERLCPVLQAITQPLPLRGAVTRA